MLNNVTHFLIKLLQNKTFSQDVGEVLLNCCVLVFCGECFFMVYIRKLPVFFAH